MDRVSCCAFGEIITSTIGDAKKWGSCSSRECYHVIIDWDNKRVYINSPSGNCICNTYDGRIIRDFRGCAEVNEEGKVVINDHDKKEVYSPF